jgi:predicted MPP superfamily phosphohydrolase
MNNIDPFTIISTLTAWLISTIAIMIVVLIVAAICSLFGVRFTSVLTHGLWFLLLPPLIFAYGFLIERNQIRTKNVDICSEHISNAADGYRIAHFSDFHLKSFEHREKVLRRFVNQINRADVDLILFTGDLVTGNVDEAVQFKQLLSQIKARDGVLSVMGNHDYLLSHNSMSDSQRIMAEKQLRECETQMGWQLLSDTCVILDNGLCIAGVENISDNSFFPSRGNLNKALKDIDAPFKILMLHDPSVWDATRPYGVNLTLSGHTHAAQMRLFGWSPSKMVYKRWYGLYERLGKNNQPEYLYVNPGLGETGFMARIGIPPEVTVITLRSKPSSVANSKP